MDNFRKIILFNLGDFSENREQVLFLNGSKYVNIVTLEDISETCF